jgi:hypothetical protein
VVGMLTRKRTALNVQHGERGHDSPGPAHCHTEPADDG